MLSLSERQRQFGRALLDPETTVPAGWVGPGGQPDARRFAVYRNNVVASLIEALGDAYPAVRRLLGEEYFAALAKVFVSGHPPTSPVMLDYGAAFPAFLETFEPLCALAYLSDVARIERAWLEAYHSAEARSEPLETLIGTIHSVPPERAGDLRLELHPSVRVVRSRWPALRIWHANVGEGSTERIDLQQGGEDALLARPQVQVQVRMMSAGEAEFMQWLQAGQSLGEALQRTVQLHAGFDLGVHLTGWFREGIMLRVCVPAQTATPPGAGPWQ